MYSGIDKSCAFQHQKQFILEVRSILELVDLINDQLLTTPLKTAHFKCGHKIPRIEINRPDLSAYLRAVS